MDLGSKSCSTKSVFEVPYSAIPWIDFHCMSRKRALDVPDQPNETVDCRRIDQQDIHCPFDVMWLEITGLMSDLFDSSVNLEEQFIEEGRQEGIRSVQLSTALPEFFALSPGVGEEEYFEKKKASSIFWRHLSIYFCQVQLVILFEEDWESHVTFRCGRRDGLRDGINLGIDKGFEIGSELGYYEGAVKVCCLLPLCLEQIINLEKSPMTFRKIVFVKSSMWKGDMRWRKVQL